jgi:phenylalanyl-tRNA synthetase beta chain
MPDHLSAADISAEIACLSPLIESVRPFDLYRGEKLGAGVKSITFSVNFRSAERTLTDSEADGVSVGIISSMEKKFGVKLRT